VAEAIFSQIEDEKDIRDASNINDLGSYDVVFFGFPIEGYGPSQPAKTFLQEQCAGKKLAVFVTHAAPEDSPFLEPWLGTCREAAAPADVIAMFNCQGELSQLVAERLASCPDPQLQAFASMRPMTVGQPDKARLERARLFAQQTMQNLASGVSA
jgi:hypothetical protein